MRPQVVVTEEVVRVIVAAQQGPRGPVGPAGGGTADLVYPAAQALSGHRAVLLEPAGLAYADAGVGAHAGRVLGITLGAAMAGEDATVRATGEISEPSWSWDVARPIWLGTGGQLTQTEPGSGAAFVQIVAVPITPQRVIVRLREPILI